jgi:general stress protein YciG
MTVQETAYVLNCSVDVARKRIKEIGVESKVGRAVVTSKRDRQRIHEAGRKRAQEQAKLRRLRATETADLAAA